MRHGVRNSAEVADAARAGFIRAHDAKIQAVDPIEVNRRELADIRWSRIRADVGVGLGRR